MFDIGSHGTLRCTAIDMRLLVSCPQRGDDPPKRSVVCRRNPVKVDSLPSVVRTAIDLAMLTFRQRLLVSSRSVMSPLIRPTRSSFLVSSGVSRLVRCNHGSISIYHGIIDCSKDVVDDGELVQSGFVATKYQHDVFHWFSLIPVSQRSSDATSIRC